MNNLYILPLVIFIIIYLAMIKLSPEEKDKTNAYLSLKNIAPAVISSVIVFLIIKYKDKFIHSEPVMSGNYFD